MTENWIEAASFDDLHPGKGVIVKNDGLQAAVFRLADDRVLAVDNLCPHEGYPLAQGYVKDCVLTCAWHNFKFDLESGGCLQGDEDVTTYPVRVVGGSVQVDLRRRARDDLDRLDASLAGGLQDDAIARVARDVARCLRAGMSPGDLVLRAAAHDAEYGEYGCGHGLAVSADVLGLLPRFPGLDATLPILHAMAIAAAPNVRRSPRPVPAATDPGADPERAGRRLFDLVEREEVEAAEGLLRGAIARGWGRAPIERWMLHLAAEHFLGFGHALIYTIKAFDLCAGLGWERARGLLPSVLVRLASSTREDTLPPMAKVRAHLEDVQARFADWRAAEPRTDWDRAALLEAVLDGRTSEARDAVTGAFEQGAGERAVVDALSVAAAERLLRFDRAIDADQGTREGWLDVTHAQTYVHAIRRALARSDDPALLRLAYFAAHFINRTRPLDAEPALRNGRRAEAPGPVDGVVEAIAAGQADVAIARAAAILEGRADAGALRVALEDLALGDALARPIVVAHAIKNTVAAFDEHRDLASDPERALPVLAVVRLLASRIVEGRTGRFAAEAVRFIGEGKPPRRLTS